MAKNKKKSSHSATTSHSSLNPEFDAANRAIMEELGSIDDMALICDTCGQEFVYDQEWEGARCSEKGCRGILLAILDGEMEDDVISLPDSIKKGGTAGSYSSSTQQSATNYGYGQGSWHKCTHPGDKVIFEHNGKKLFASNSSSLKEYSGKWDLIIDLAGIVTLPSKSGFVSDSSAKRLQELGQLAFKKEELPSEYLRLHWNDMQAPPVGLAFWERLWELLPEKTVIACIGGHGRTGTCLAALMITSGMDYYSAVETVRTEHCDRAIETYSQEYYLHTLYVVVMQTKLAKLQKADNPCKGEIDDLIEDIKWAEANPPKKETTTSSTSSSSHYGTGVVVRYYSKTNRPANGSKELLEAIDSDRPVMTETSSDGKVEILVEECVENNCPTVACNVYSHQGYVEWEKSMTKQEQIFTKP